MSLPDAPLELHITVTDADSSAVQLLYEAVKEAANEAPKETQELSKQAIKAAMTNGAVWLTRGTSSQRLRRAKRALQHGDKLHLYYNPQVQAEIPPEPDLIADVGDYSVWRKPSGMRSHGSKWGDHCTIMRWAETHLQPERTSFTVHRLDLAASGLILVAHSKSCAAALAKLFQERRIDKRYRAIVHGDFSQQTVPLRIESPIDGKASSSTATFLQLSADSQRSLLDVNIETGRKHQIRRHLAETGWPIVGDRLYGEGAADGADLQLTAYRLAFDCPVENKPAVYELPAEWLPKL